MKISQKAKSAFLLGALCSISYFAVYIARNILGAVTPQMVDGRFTEEYIGAVSSLYFMAYAFGQLINGAIGDKIKARWMMSIGLFGAGFTNLIFSLIITNKIGATVAYAATGFFLSMIYGPMTKVVSENTEHIYAVRCGVGYTFASFFGSPAAGLLASFLAWQNVFTISSVALFIMAISCFLVFIIFEKKRIVRYNTEKERPEEAQSLKVLFKYNIIKFSIVSILTGIVRTSVVFWLPTYISQHLSFSPKQSAGIFTVSTVFISLSALIAIFIYERLGRRMNLSLFLMFAASALFFLLTFLVTHPILNIIFIVVAIISADCASSILWSVYCPSLKDTGRVSGATGFLDFLSYMAAAAANLIFANAASDLGWGNLILIWCALMLIGVLISIPYRRRQLDS